MAYREERKSTERPSGRKRRGKFRYLLGLLCVGVVLLVAFLPTMVARRSVIVPLIDRFAGIAPLKVDLETVRAGWFKPVEATGIQLLDGEGRLLAKIGSIHTEKGVWGWIRNSSDLGILRISQVEAAVAASGGTTNIEQALQPLMVRLASTQDASQEISSSSTPTGTIEITDSKFLLMEPGRAEQWELTVPKLTVTLPSASQVIGPIDLQATLADASGTVTDSLGTIAANVQQPEGSSAFEVRAKLERIPVDFWHVVRARLPEIPVEELSGRVTGILSGTIVDAERWSFDIQQIESRDLQVVAPELVGAQPLRLKLIAASGRAALADAMLKVEQANLNCDFAQAQASAAIPWPIVVPTATDPFLQGAVLSAQGAVDLPKLVKAAQSLIPLRENTQLMAGQAQFAISQQLGAQLAPTSRAKLELTGLQAMAAGQNISWNDPLSMELAAERGTSGLQIAAKASAEFCNLQGGGTIEAGTLAGSVNLDLLQKRLSEYVELPIRTMTGSANVDMSWKMVAASTVEALGQLTTTPMTLASSTGGTIQEPAWKGDFSATAILAQGVPQSIQRAQLSLTSPDEQLSVELQEPLSLVAVAHGQPASPAAAFTMNLVGDLANWKRRGTMWLTEPPELKLSGNLSMALRGNLDMTHVELLEANWRSQPLEVSTSTMSFAEPQMVGSFKGRVDTNDLTRLMVEKLEVQSTSFSLGARDSANADGSGSRVGQAMFLVDLDRLMKSVNSQSSPSAAAPPLGGFAGQPPVPTTQYSATGRAQGQLAWQVSPQAAAFEIRTEVENIVLLSKASDSPAAVPLWDEPKLSSQIQGHWIAQTGAVNIESLQLQTPWMNYVGNLAYSTTNAIQNVRMKGQAVYDSVQLTNKLTPLVGNQVRLYGQQTVPIEVNWTSSADPALTALAGLTAAARIGWEQASVAGIQLGRADVPVTVTAGQLATEAEFPVSGGKLRWNVTSDLTADELVILQKPMMVLENVQITEQMCQDWLKYVAPLLAEATSVDGRLSVRLDEARLTPANPKMQTVRGQLAIHKATVGPGPLSNQIIGLVKQLDALRKKDFAQPVSSQQVWLNMAEQQIDFQMAEGRVMHRNLNVKVGDANISTAGAVGIDGQLDMLATLPIPDDWTEKSPLLAGLRGQELQFPVRGTLSKPQLDSDGLKQFGRQAVQNAASGVIQQQLTKGLGKLFGGAPPAIPTAVTPPIQASPPGIILPSQP